MSNIGKHLFLAFSGSMTYRGEIIAETEESFMVRYKTERTRRVARTEHDIPLPGYADPDAALEAWEGAYAMHGHAVEEARDALNLARQTRSFAAKTAMLKEAGI